MSSRLTRPKRFDREMSYVYMGQQYQIFVNIRRCPCSEQKVFERRCEICGRYLPSQMPVYLEIVRPTEIRLVRKGNQ